MIKEWNFFRAFACLTIVFLHSTTHIGRLFETNIYENIQSFRVMMTYATPSFIILSEIILANKYHSHIPDKFFHKRIKYIVSPFILWAIIDAFVWLYLGDISKADLQSKIIDNLLGNYVGYFIIIIFQFYILHYLIVKFNISVKKLLPWSFIIMIAHLNIMYMDIPLIKEFRQELRLPFTAWFGYFTIAYLIGANYDKIKKFVREYRWLILIGVCFSAYLVYTSYNYGNTFVNSRRIDLIPLVITISLLLISIGQSIPKSKIINLISNYSLGIYLVHWQVQRILVVYIDDLFPTIEFKIVGMFIISLCLTILVIKIISLFPFGKYIVGNTKRNYKNKNILTLYNVK